MEQVEKPAARRAAAPMLLVAGIAVIAALGGLLFGYDTGIIGVALLGLSQDFQLNDVSKQIVTGAIILGALIGCLVSGPVSDRLGRRRAAMAVGALFLIGSAFSAGSPNVPCLIASRLVLGLSAGGATQILPVYIAEASPPSHRGVLVTLFQFMVVFGITSAYFTGLVLGSHWRWMFALGLLPALVLLVGMIFLPESPRWLLGMGRTDEALAILKRIRGSEAAAKQELTEIRSVAEQPQGSWRDLASRWIRPAVITGAGIAMFSQITGNNALFYYAPTILIKAGFSEHSAVLGTGCSTILVAIATVLGSILVDRVGRRRYLLWMIPGSIIALVVLGFSFQGLGLGGTQAQILTVACLAAYLVFNCASFGVCIWLINAEVYPLFVRGKGASLGAFSHWLFDLLVSLTTLSLVSWLGVTHTFWLYAWISLVALVFVYYLVPETRGKSLEQIEHDLRAERFFPYQQKRKAKADSASG